MFYTAILKVQLVYPVLSQCAGDCSSAPNTLLTVLHFSILPGCTNIYCSCHGDEILYICLRIYISGIAQYQSIYICALYLCTIFSMAET